MIDTIVECCSCGKKQAVRLVTGDQPDGIDERRFAVAEFLLGCCLSSRTAAKDIFARVNLGQLRWRSPASEALEALKHANGATALELPAVRAWLEWIGADPKAANALEAVVVLAEKQ